MSSLVSTGRVTIHRFESRLRILVFYETNSAWPSFQGRQNECQLKHDALAPYLAESYHKWRFMLTCGLGKDFSFLLHFVLGV